MPIIVRPTYVREYFIVALRYDPDNPRAKQYLDKVDNFKSGLVRAKLKTANTLLAKPKRKEDEDFALIVALQTASAIDPANDSAAKLLKDNSAVSKRASRIPIIEAQQGCPGEGRRSRGLRCDARGFERLRLR